MVVAKHRAGGDSLQQFQMQCYGTEVRCLKGRRKYVGVEVCMYNCQGRLAKFRIGFAKFRVGLQNGGEGFAKHKCNNRIL